MQEPKPVRLQENHVLKAKFVIDRFLGEGGVAYNYLAHFIDNLSRKVVIKQTKRYVPLTNEISDDRFQMEREFRLLHELDDPRIPKAFEMFEISNILYFVREYREGEPLESHIERGMRRSRIFDIAVEILSVLEYLHKFGIIYRDLKPSNILVDDDGKVSLFDFGTARFYKEGKNSDTVILGTPGFAAPEQYGRSQSSEQTDIYSFGAVLYYMMTGENPEDNPFKFGEEANIRSKIQNEFLADIMVRCLALNPRHRFRTTRELHLKMLRVRFFAGKKGQGKEERQDTPDLLHKKPELISKAIFALLSILFFLITAYFSIPTLAQYPPFEFLKEYLPMLMFLTYGSELMV